MIPEKVKVAGLVYTIMPDGDNLKDEHKYAQTDSGKLLIRIDTNRPTQLLQTTLLHEVLHAINNIYVGTASLSEDQIDHLEAGLYQVLSDNPMLMSFIFEEIPICYYDDETVQTFGFLF